MKEKQSVINAADLFLPHLRRDLRETNVAVQEVAAFLLPKTPLGRDVRALSADITEATEDDTPLKAAGVLKTRQFKSLRKWIAERKNANPDPHHHLARIHRRLPLPDLTLT